MAHKISKALQIVLLSLTMCCLLGCPNLGAIHGAPAKYQRLLGEWWEDASIIDAAAFGKSHAISVGWDEKTDKLIVGMTDDPTTGPENPTGIEVTSVADDHLDFTFRPVFGSPEKCRLVVDPGNSEKARLLYQKDGVWVEEFRLRRLSHP